jgi:chromosome segregation ATPase
MSLTDDILHELIDKLGSNLDWQQFLAKHGASKGPLYNAIGRFFTEKGAEIIALNEKRNRVQSKLDQAGLELDSLDRKKIEAESNIASLENREDILAEKVKNLEVDLTTKSELVNHLEGLEKLGLDGERLNLLRDTLRQAGEKHGLNIKEAVSKFFGYLKDYDLVLEAEVQLKGLQTQIETKKLEAENWQAKEEALGRKHDDLKEAIDAVHNLIKRGIKADQIIAWHKVLARFQTVEQLAESLARYGDMTNLLKSKKEEVEGCELRLAKTKGQVEILEKEKVKVEGAIEAIKTAGIKELKVMTEEAKKRLEDLTTTEVKAIRDLGQDVRAELTDDLSRIDTLNQKVFEIGQELERKQQELQKYEGIKEILESHVAASGKDNELREQP